jgi:hypothetical protein
VADVVITFYASAQAFNWGVEAIEPLVLNALRASYLPTDDKQKMEAEFARLRGEHGLRREHGLPG